ncbi:hypothetical protein HGRIS_007144 [Hohenbuehelia grisea]|uniref:F-box domain-containing protein n=1 Tax=Hohenbuehelia grisea TaxID=104357 RepID=A0ABR3JCC2_9AGAR
MDAVVDASSFSASVDSSDYFPPIPEPAIVIYDSQSPTGSILDLPRELIMSIFEFLVDYYYTPKHFDLTTTKEAFRLKQAFALMHVCRHFRHIAYHTPLLWRSVDVKEPAMLTRFLLERSQAILLEVESPSRWPFTEEILPVLLGEIIDQHVDRLGSLSVDLNSREHMNNLLSRLLRHACIPRLYHLSVYRPNTPSEESRRPICLSDVLNPEFMPCLRALTVRGPYLWEATCFPHLTSLRLWSSGQTWTTSEILNQLKNMPLLQILSIEQPFSKDDLKTLEGTPHPSRILQLLHLRAFSLDSRGDRGFWKLLEFLHLPALTAIKCTFFDREYIDNDSALVRIDAWALQSFTNILKKSPHFAFQYLDFQVQPTSLTQFIAHAQSGHIQIILPKRSLSTGEDIRDFNNLPLCLPSLDAVDELVINGVSSGTTFYARLLNRTPTLTHLIVSDDANDMNDTWYTVHAEDSPPIDVEDRPLIDVEDIISVLSGIAFSERLGNLSASELSALRLCPRLAFLDITSGAPISKERHLAITSALRSRSKVVCPPRDHALTLASSYVDESTDKAVNVITTYAYTKDEECFVIA